ncbi:unnamed protein product, partial [Heterosigma akashiwo]
MWGKVCSIQLTIIGEIPNLLRLAAAQLIFGTRKRTEPVHSYKCACLRTSYTSYSFSFVCLCHPLLLANPSSIPLGYRNKYIYAQVILQMRTNKVAWNPMEPFYFVAANEDHNLYTFDMRNMERAIVIHKDHVSAVMDVAFSPTGREFVSGSYDRTTRIFGYRSGKSREVYHTKRMHRIFCVNFSADSRFILTGSDDTNIRIWKARAAKPVAKMALREERKMAYRESLKKRFGHLPEV